MDFQIQSVLERLRLVSQLQCHFQQTSQGTKLRKRIRLHQLKPGMFVEEIEGSTFDKSRCQSPIGFVSALNIDPVMNSNALSVIINVRKGIDVTSADATFETECAWFRKQISSRYSPKEIAEARAAMNSTAFHIRNLLSGARLGKAVSLDGSIEAVETIMSSSLRSREAMISLSRMKTKDEGTFLHSLAVSALMMGLARELHMGDDDVKLFGVGGMVHDIGKMALPASILQKAGKLSPREIAIIRTHCTKGYEFLSQLQEPPPMVLDICLYHHERYDGAGYPSNLSGELIPLAARIASICDVYDALTSIRPYKRAWSQSEAIELMTQSPGHFDQDLLDVFVSKVIGAPIA